ncbi:MAG: AI-2E family transporter [Clostridia bacterium]|nr:AI-2E family transporter [Clostridia bacterium]
MFKIDWNRKYTTIAAYACIVIAIAVVILVVGLNFDRVSAGIHHVIDVLNPIFVGVIIAYLCNPLFRLLESKAFAFVERKKRRRRLRRGLALTSTYLIVLLVIVLFLLLVVPQIVGSYNDLVARFSSYINSAVAFADNFIREFPLFGDEYQSINDFIDPNAISAKIKELLTESGDFLTSLTNNVLSYGVGFVNTALDILLAIIISIYLLAAKEKMSARVKKILSAFLPKERVQSLWELATYTDHTFGGFIVGKLLDSLIIGILSFFVFAIFKMPYYPLLAVIVGVTNVIPFFGPFIGAIPSIFIVFIAEPSKTLWLALLILIIQQLDGNVIGPKILGDSTGLSSLGVVVSITIMGGYFGVAGMFFGVPLFAVICSLLKKYIEGRLGARELPTETEAYYTNPDAIPDNEDSALHRLLGQVWVWMKKPVKYLADRRSAGRREKK